MNKVEEVEELRKWLSDELLLHEIIKTAANNLICFYIFPCKYSFLFNLNFIKEIATKRKSVRLAINDKQKKHIFKRTFLTPFKWVKLNSFFTNNKS